MLPLTRREFIHRSAGGGLGFLAFTGAAPSFLAQSALAQTPGPERDRTILVVIQLAGGNDGLNTVVPHTDDNYHRLRPTIGLKEDLLPINHDLALHPSCGALHELFNAGQLSIIQNVGYPNPNRSHFRSTEIWETASGSDEVKHEGWLGRFFDNTCSGAPEENADPSGVHIGDIIPQSFLAARSHSVFGMRPWGRVDKGRDPAEVAYEKLLQAQHMEGNASYLQHTMMNTLVTERRVEKVIAGYNPMVDYPRNKLSQSLKRIAALIHADMETRIYFVSQGGYDTHAGQQWKHAKLLAELSGAMGAFQKDLVAHKKDDQVLTMTFSEFGRRPSENGSQGTDHGTAAPLFVMGSQTRGGLLGSAPSLDLGHNKDLKFSTDFRSVYSCVLDRWLEADATKVLGESYEPVPFI
ncbi:twin-arginine translocation pathway signal protein [Coraliomargarita sinensis]|uniref:Twin-arginine translocation pathway signal protein n=1 Tax=Coraliomargarita sinensis TaxID=2174842 RepID=A0A317ZGU5_9BACT|nr:DUF1501 domain-containing protein [Coraliomargarita sinensis]PXA04132.1 twin-arginine translocation pathway signal protein [Coraliomargarita sinensis]